MIVINSSPAINLGRALGELVMREIETGAPKDATARMLEDCCGIHIRPQPVSVAPFLAHELDQGEAAVIQTALAEGIATVILDDLKARRLAGLVGLEVTGSLGVLVLAKQVGKIKSLGKALDRKRAGGAWLDDALIQRALQLAGEE